MRERARALVGGRAAAKLAVSTFHSLGVRILREHGERVGLPPNFSILDSDDVLGMLKEAGGTTDNALARRWQWAISAVEEPRPRVGGGRGGGARGRARGDERRRRVVAARVMQRYEERLAAYQAVDFDDLIVLPRAPARRRRRGARRVARRACATSSSTSTRTPTASSTSC